MKLTGSQIYALLEQQFPPTAELHEAAAESGHQIHLQPVDSRLARASPSLTLTDGTPILPDATTYTVAMNEFIATGGDGFSVFLGGTNVTRIGVSDLDALIEYVQYKYGSSACQHAHQPGDLSRWAHHECDPIADRRVRIGARRRHAGGLHCIWHQTGRWQRDRDHARSSSKTAGGSANPMRGTTAAAPQACVAASAATRPCPLLPSRPMEIMGVQIRTIMPRQRRDAAATAASRSSTARPGGSTSSTSSPPRRRSPGRSARRSTRARSSSTAIRPASGAGWPARATSSAGAARSARSCGRSPIPGRGRPMGPVRRHPPRRPRVRARLTPTARRSRRSGASTLDARAIGLSSARLAARPIPRFTQVRAKILADGSGRASPHAALARRHPTRSRPQVPDSAAHALHSRAGRRAAVAVARPRQPAARASTRTRSGAGPTRVGSRRT